MFYRELRRKRGNVLVDRVARHGGTRFLARYLFLLVCGAAGLAAYSGDLRYALAEEAQNPPSPEPDSTSAEAVPFTGNVELKARLDASGPLTIAGQRMHVDLLRRFYVANDYQTVWETHGAAADRMREQILLHAGDDGLDPGLFHGAALGLQGPALSPVERDLLLSDAFLSYADALARGAYPVEERIDDEDLTPEPVDIVAVLDAAITDPDPEQHIAALAPSSPEYIAMRRAYMDYRALAAGARTVRGKSERAAPAQMAAADRRAQQLAVNLERLRWLPRRPPADRVVVNAAIARLQLFRDNRPVFTTKVVVGELDKQTPELQSTIDSVLFNPPWNIPRSIAQKEILPKLAEDPGYLSSHHMRFRSNGAVQQEAGPYSALGRLKFEMNDRYDVYLHDTPTKSLFQAASRMMSHGCVRVENPRTLAAMLLGAEPESIDKGIAVARTHRRGLPAAMPIFIVYQTAYVEADGSIQFRGDPYARDEEIWQHLNRAHQLPIAQDSAPGQRKG
jgi:L,D-transpeptidase YcbB